MTDHTLSTYAAHLLANTGLAASQIASLTEADAAHSAAADALLAGWESARGPVPELPLAPYSDQEAP